MCLETASKTRVLCSGHTSENCFKSCFHRQPHPVHGATLDAPCAGQGWCPHIQGQVSCLHVNVEAALSIREAPCMGG